MYGGIPEHSRLYKRLLYHSASQKRCTNNAGAGGYPSAPADGAPRARFRLRSTLVYGNTSSFHRTVAPVLRKRAAGKGNDLDSIYGGKYYLGATGVYVCCDTIHIDFRFQENPFDA